MSMFLEQALSWEGPQGGTAGRVVGALERTQGPGRTGRRCCEGLGGKDGRAEARREMQEVLRALEGGCRTCA